MHRFSQPRPAVAADTPAIARIAEETGLFPPNMLGDMIAGYLTRRKDDHWFVCEANGAVAAFGFCEPERLTSGTWNLLAIGVLPRFQGQGAGRAMMGYIERWLADRGHRILLVETMGTPELAATRAFYASAGYTEEARIREYYEPGADKVVFWKFLQPR